jgi:Ricin-type beta-trefoil lectin domain-like
MAPETASGAGDADETGADASDDTGADANEDGGTDSGSTLDTGTVVDTGSPATEAGLGSGPFQIVNLSTGLVIDNSGGSGSSGNPVIQYAANGGTNQAWSPVSVAGGAYLLVNQKSSLALDLSGTSTVQATVTGSATQQWTFFPAGTAGYYTITSGGGAGVLTSPSSSQNVQLVVSPGVGSPSQQWRLVPAQ